MSELSTGVTNSTEASERRGLLDIRMTLSNPDPTAGSEFTVYVLVTNLFDVPIWPTPPRVFLPSEMMPVSSKDPIEDSVKNLSSLLEQAAKGKAPIIYQPKTFLEKIFGRNSSRMREVIQRLAERVQMLENDLQNIEESKSQIQKSIEELTRGKSLSERMDMLNDNEEFRQISAQEAELTKQTGIIRDEISDLTTQIVTLTGSSAVVSDGDLKINNLNSSSSLYVQAIGNVDISMASSQLVTLESSLDYGLPLQPGNTVVYSIALTTRKTVFFRPIQYALQYSINFSFGGIGGIQHTNTATQQLTIRAPIISVMIGAILGGAAGYVSKFLQNIANDIFFQDWLQSIILLGLTMILSAMAVVFLARKSETQALISVEDFWGGLVIGFLVGYTGISFFENIAGI